MPLLKFAWVTSCLSLLLAYSQSLLRLPDSLSSTVGYSFEMSIASASATPLSTTATSGLQSSLVGALERGLNQSRQDEARHSPLAFHSTSFETFTCPLWSEPQQPITPISSTSPPTESESPRRGIPQRLGRALKRLFNPRSESSVPQKSTVEVSVKSALETVSFREEERFSAAIAPQQARSPQRMGVRVAPRSGFQVWVNGRAIAKLDKEHQADLIADRLRVALEQPDFEASAIRPGLIGDKPVAMMGERMLFVVNEAIAPQTNLNRELLAIQWIERLRAALGAPPLQLAEAQRKMYDLVETSQTLEGLASWYGDYFHGRLTANGETYNQHAFTAAHPSLPFNTFLKVTNLDNSNSVIVRINDRGPFIAPRTLDLSRGVAQCIGSEQAGVIPYRATIMKPHSPLDDI
ncbi:MAG: septal ring lytic transglycosylase RlpA family protein [Cyanobacteriota bacterium]|nr:septal ring lytic transglycosylase RlpA family protein [Cyanobacteriota bacterium]